jgi:hypothetical protein
MLPGRTLALALLLALAAAVVTVPRAADGRSSASPTARPGIAAPLRGPSW